MNTTNSFSVLMSLYDKEKPNYLHDCFESLAQQTLTASEIVVVFDGPISNELSAVVNLWQAKLPIKVIKLAKNVGLGNALNAGFQACNNEIIIRMDTDDICVKERFDKQMAAFNDDETLALVGGFIEEYDSELQYSSGIRSVPLSQHEIQQYAKLKNPFNHMTVAFKKSAISKVGGYIDHPFMEDYNLWLRMISSKLPMSNLAEVLVKARAGDDMVNRRRGMNYINSEWKLAKHKFNLRIQSLPASFATFIIRALPRLLPLKLIKSIYKINRTKSI